MKPIIEQKVKCVACLHRRFLPVTNEVIRWHLSGRDVEGRDFVMDVYPMLQDETCFFLAADHRSTVTLFCAFSPRTWASTSIRCSMLSYGRFLTAPIDAS